jgi:hypothetical protein
MLLGFFTSTQKSLCVGSLALVMLVCSAPRADADGILANQTYAPTPLFQGTALFDGYGVDSLGHPDTSIELKADIDYAVFAPGNFPASDFGTIDPATLFVPSTPNTPSSFVTPNAFTYTNKDYIYAYQIFNKGGNTAGTSYENLDVSSVRFGLGLTNPPTNPIDSAGQSNPSKDPSAISLSYYDVIDDATEFQFTMKGEIDPGQESEILFYSSPLGPGLVQSYILGGLGTAPLAQLPSPALPESSAPLTPAPDAFFAGGSLLLIVMSYRVAKRTPLAVDSKA